MKLAFINLAASLPGAVLVTAGNAADRQDLARTQGRAQMTERAKPVQIAEASPNSPLTGSFACVHGRCGELNDRDPPIRAASGPHHPFPPGPLTLALQRGAIETFIGINADQFDTWRVYANALQAMIRPPALAENSQDEPPDALAQSSMLARGIAVQWQQAVKLAAAIDALRSKLAPEQLERVKEAGPPLPPRPPGPGLGAPSFPHLASIGLPQGPGSRELVMSH